MSARWWALGVWAAVAASVFYWGVRLFVARPPDPHRVQITQTDNGDTRPEWTRLLGAETPPPPSAEIEAQPADARFQLLGVISPHRTQSAWDGLALIAVDGKPPRVIRVGAVVAEHVVLQVVGVRSARLGLRHGAALIVLSLATPASATANVTLANAKSSQEKLASNQLPAPLTEQQAFSQRQQIQFQQEEMQNQGAIPPDPVALPNTNSPAQPSKLH